MATIDVLAVRHGYPEGGNNNIDPGMALSPQNRELLDIAASMLAGRAQSKEIELRFFSSPRSRALQTAEALAEHPSLSGLIVPQAVEATPILDEDSLPDLSSYGSRMSWHLHFRDLGVRAIRECGSSDIGMVLVTHEPVITALAEIHRQKLKHEVDPLSISRFAISIQ